MGSKTAMLMSIKAALFLQSTLPVVIFCSNPKFYCIYKDLKELLVQIKSVDLCDA